MTAHARFKPGQALAEKCDANERKWRDLTNARRNEAAAKQLVYGGELRADELVARHRDLKRECAERHPEWFA